MERCLSSRSEGAEGEETLEEDLLANSAGIEQRELARVQIDIHRLRVETVQRLALMAEASLEKDPGTEYAVFGWLRQETANLERNLFMMRENVREQLHQEREARDRGIRAYCEGRKPLQHSPQAPTGSEE